MGLTFDLQPGDDRLFTDESLEQIEAIEGGLLELERGDPGPDVVNRVFRAAHTLKGSAATIGHRRMAELTHAMEDIFGALRSGTIADIVPFADVLLSTIDVLRALVEEVTAGTVLTDAPEGLTHRLRELLDQAEQRRDGASPAAAATHGDDPAPASGGPVDRLLRSAPPPTGPRSIVTCRIDPSSDWRSVRLLQALIEAADGGALLASVPTQDEIEAGAGGTDLLVLLSGEPAGHDALLARLGSVDDVAELTIDEAPEAPPVASEGPPGAGDWDGRERRQVDLGPEARGLAPAERAAVAVDRLKTSQQTIRIDVARLDELMNLVGELVVQKTRLQRQASQLMVRLGDDPLAREAEEGSQQFARIVSQLQDRVTGLRMLPIETIFNRFPRVARDISARLGKEVELVVEGKETELDRSVLDEVGDPLGHIVRNALDHGLETPDVRTAAGKPAMGRIRLSARHADGMIEITVEDDGRGMDPAALRAAAVSKGLFTAENVAALSDAEVLRLIFMPGFSTAARVTDVSGRGVGMDVVRTNIERLGGRVDVSSTVGVGTRVSLWLPLTLAIIGAMLVRSGGRVCALPLAGVVETIRVAADAISHVLGNPILSIRGRVVPVTVLDSALGDPARPLRASARGYINVVVVRSRDAELALTVDEFVGEQEIVLKSMTVFTGRLVGISGATILADGSVALVVDIGALIGRLAVRSRSAA